VILTEGIELNKVKYIHSCDTSRTPLNTDFGNKNEGQDCTIGPGLGGVIVGGSK
jgi:hypothetical protein